MHLRPDSFSSQEQLLLCSSCHGCRICSSLCNVFATLLDLPLISTTGMPPSCRVTTLYPTATLPRLLLVRLVILQLGDNPSGSYEWPGSPDYFNNMYGRASKQETQAAVDEAAVTECDAKTSDIMMHHSVTPSSTTLGLRTSKNPSCHMHVLSNACDDHQLMVLCCILGASSACSKLVVCCCCSVQTAHCKILGLCMCITVTQWHFVHIWRIQPHLCCW